MAPLRESVDFGALVESCGPMSPVQQRLYLCDQLDPGNPAYNLPPIAFRINGELRIDVLEACLTEIARRHEVLRTAFQLRDGKPEQVVLAPQTVIVPITNLAAEPASTIEQRLYGLAQREARAPFDLSAGRLMRVRLFRLAPGDHLLLIVFHHIISDAWSIGVFYREFAALYEALANGGPSPLAELPIQYRDFAEWQRSELDDATVANDMAFWRTALANLPEPLSLPLDRPRGATPSFEATRHTLEVPEDLPDALASFNDAAGATLYMTLAAAFNALLFHHTGRLDVTHGCPVAGRSTIESESLIGFFVNTVVVRTRLAPELTFRELLSRIKETLLDVYDHQELPFDRLVEALRPARDPRHNPLFQVMFSLQNTRVPVLKLGHLSVRPERIHNGTSQFEFILFAGTHLDGRLRAVQFEYNTDLFDAATMARLEGHFWTLLRRAISEPDVRIADVELLDANERSVLAALERNPLCAPPVGETLVSLFERQVAARPDAPAVIFEAECLSYRELDERASQLAARLTELGVQAETPVAISLPRCAGWAVAILAVLKAGGAYVPLSDTDPLERRERILRDAGVRLLITEYADAHTVALTCVSVSAGRHSVRTRASSAIPVRPDQAAYIIYTSGSTGTPKGIVVRHKNVTWLLAAGRERFGLGASDVWSVFHSFAFDYSVWELWGALAHGGCAVVVSDALRKSPDLFAALVRGEGITVLSETPSAFTSLIAAVEDFGAPPPPALRLIVFGGERLDLPSLRGWYERSGDAGPELVNMYGISETTVHVTARTIRSGEVDTPFSPLGTPLPGAEIYTLSPGLSRVPIGVEGELVVGAGGVARGYLGRPALTALKFVPDRLANADGARWYRSGDLGRRLGTEDLVFSGRRDSQLKVRGYRVELSEVSAALASHDAVLEQAVVVRRSDSSDSIAAFVVLAPGRRASETEIRAHVATRVPSYMVPASIGFVDALPVTPHGKLDTAALLARSVDAREVHRAPRTDTERRIAAIWSELFGGGSANIDQNFFECGGHSLLATRLAVELREAFDRELSVRAVFEGPTIAELAQLIDAAPARTAAEATPKIGRASRLRRHGRESAGVG